MAFKPIPRELFAFINRHETFFILGHVEPDGDCLGSQLALKSYLERKGKKAVLFSPGPFKRREVLALEPLFKTRLSEADLKTPAGVFILDCAAPDRLGSLAEDIAGRETAVIDHHSAGDDGFGDIRCVEPKAPCVTLLIQNLIESSGDRPTPEEAYHLFFGFSTDTGFFRHLEFEAAEALAMVSRLAAQGVTPRTIYRDTYGSYPLESRIFIADALKTAERFSGGRLILVHELLDHALRFQNENRQTDTVYQLLLSTEGCEALAFIREEEPGRTSVSLRSADKLDVGLVARSFGGGGHKNAAGFTTPLPFEEIKPRLLDAFAGVFGRG